MGRTGSALDNAVAESFHSTLEFELLRGGALRHSSQGAGSGRRLPGGVQLGASALHLRNAFPSRLRAHPGRGGGMTIGCAARLQGRPSSLKGRSALAARRPQAAPDPRASTAPHGKVTVGRLCLAPPTRGARHKTENQLRGVSTV
jgi:hypothetical protein